MTAPTRTLRSALGELLGVLLGIGAAFLALLLQVGAVVLWVSGLVVGLWLHRWHPGYLLIMSSPISLAAATQLHRFSQRRYEQRVRRDEAADASVWDDPRVPSS
jgi:membrane protein implicated in regulation of membrane protease activity